MTLENLYEKIKTTLKFSTVISVVYLYFAPSAFGVINMMFGRAF